MEEGGARVTQQAGCVTRTSSDPQGNHPISARVSLSLPRRRSCRKSVFLQGQTQLGPPLAGRAG